MILLFLLASPVFGIELTERQKQAIGQLITPKAGGFTVQVLGGTAAPPWLSVTGTLPSSPSGDTYGTYIGVTSAGSASFLQIGTLNELYAGYTGSTQTSGIYATNAAAGTSSLSGSAANDSNVAVRGLATAGTTGTMIGVLGYADNSDSTGFHVGVVGEAPFDSSGRGYGLVGHGSTTGVGGYFLLRSTTSPWTPVADLATALIADNGTQGSGSILGAKQAGALVWQIGVQGGLWSKSGTKTLTDATATTFVRIGVSSNGRQGGLITYCVDANDATDYQTRCGTVSFSGINESGTEDCDVGTPADSESPGGGGLTVTFDTETAGTNQCGIRANATSSLTETTLRINYSVQLFGNAATIIAPQ